MRNISGKTKSLQNAGDAFFEVESTEVHALNSSRLQLSNHANRKLHPVVFNRLVIVLQETGSDV